MPQTFYTSTFQNRNAWWRHQMETFSALLALCAGNSPVTGEFLSQRPVTQSFGVFFDLRLTKRLRKQSRPPVIWDATAPIITSLWWCNFCTQSTSWKQAPVPLSIFRSNSKFDENSKHSSVQYTRPITTIFCTRHDSVTVVTCAKYRCDRSSIFETKAFWIFIEFQIRSKYA